MRISLLLIFLIALCPSFAQNYKVKGGLSSVDTAELTILNIYPDSFPNVSVVFRAERRTGEPVWGLTKEKMKVKENGTICTVVSVAPISEHKPISLGIVIDHSGSMSAEGMQYFLGVTNGVDAPINNAKKAVKKFVAGFNSTKDKVCIVGFSDTVDKPLPLSQDVSLINAVVDSMHAENSTALYDAMMEGIAQITGEGSLRVLIVLTDGMDNSSRSLPDDVIQRARKEDIPIYIIGLGIVNSDTLQYIANNTRGQYFYTRSSSSLSDIYALISKRLQAYYDLVYTSGNISMADPTRVVELSFDVDSLYISAKPDTMQLPAEVIAHMQQKEKQKEYMLYGGGAVAALAGLGVLLFFFVRRKKEKPVILKLYPNPSTGLVNVEYEPAEGSLLVCDISGYLALEQPVSGEKTQVDLSHLADGEYITWL
ncbi:MAG: VWA domain-containing protein, partial [Taibaiella sp.]|nr:VWA domain-containing protein [Taibaiella sp.]